MLACHQFKTDHARDALTASTQKSRISTRNRCGPFERWRLIRCTLKNKSMLICYPFTFLTVCSLLSAPKSKNGGTVAKHATFLRVAPGLSWGKCKKNGTLYPLPYRLRLYAFLSRTRWAFPPMTAQNIGGGCLSWWAVAVCLLLVVGGCLPFVAVRLLVSIGGGIRSQKKTFLYTICIFRKSWQRGAVWCIV